MKTTRLIAVIAFSWSIVSYAEGPTSDFTLHEWGTFTSVSGSDGALLPGLEAEEERLPYFVESHAGMRNQFEMQFSKGWNRPLSGVTIKMETPVIYFYTKQAFAAQVKVGFKGGSISQWFPRRTSGETPPPVNLDKKAGPIKDGAINFAAKPYDGSIIWDVQVTPAGDDAAGRIFKSGETTNWLYPRQTDSALVTTANGDTEKYLFYRGVGNFTPAMKFSMSDDFTLNVENRSGGEVPGGLVYEYRKDGSVRFTPLGSIAAGAKTSVRLDECPPTKDWQKGVYEALAKQLVAAGLYRKEADAMIQTWWSSYFQKPGLRVFWIVPAKSTEETLPLTVSPAPKAQVRVLVGRSEILSPGFERQLVSDFADREKNPWGGDRYYGPYAARVQQLVAK